MNYFITFSVVALVWNRSNLFHLLPVGAPVTTLSDFFVQNTTLLAPGLPPEDSDFWLPCSLAFVTQPLIIGPASLIKSQRPFPLLPLRKKETMSCCAAWRSLGLWDYSPHYVKEFRTMRFSTKIQQLGIVVARVFHVVTSKRCRYTSDPSLLQQIRFCLFKHNHNGKIYTRFSSCIKINNENMIYFPSRSYKKQWISDLVWLQPFEVAEIDDSCDVRRLIWPL